MNTTPTEPPSDDRDELVRLLPELVDRDLPSSRQRQLQEFVMSQIHQDLSAADQPPQRRPRRRFVLAASAAGVVAVLTAAAIVIGTNGSSSAPPALGPAPNEALAGLTPVSQTFELAADYAAAQPFTAPRPDQWIYTSIRDLNPSSLAKAKGQNPDTTYQSWVRIDGVKKAEIYKGKLNIWDQSSDYPTLSHLPTDPATLLATVRAKVLAPPADPSFPRPAGFDDPEHQNVMVFQYISQVLEEYLLPPAVTAALWRAEALIPGVSQAPGTVDLGGRKAIAVGRVQDGWAFDQLLLDPDTHEFVGYRSVAVADHTIDTGVPAGSVNMDPGAPTSVSVKKGDVQYIESRLAAKIVDAAGQTH